MHPRILLLLVIALGVVLIVANLTWPIASSFQRRRLPSACAEARIQAHMRLRPVVIVTTVTNPSFQISLHPQEYDKLRWKITSVGQYYDHILTEIARRFLYEKPKSVVVDVGANIGWLSLYAMAMGHSVWRYEFYGQASEC